MKTFTTYAEKKAKQFLNLLQGYTKGIRLTAILILLLMGVTDVWAWCGNSFIIVNDTWCTGSNSYVHTGGYFNGKDLGTLTTLKLGGELQVYPSSNTAASLYYKIDSGSEKSISLPKTGNDGNNSKHSGSGTVDLSTLSGGQHTIEVWFKHGSDYDSNGSKNYKATFTIDPVVTFKANGGTGSDYTQTVKYNTATALTANKFTRTGYSFNGWKTAANSGTSYADKANVTFKANTSLYAQWTPDKYTIIYKDQGGSNFSGTHASGYPTTHTYGTATTLKDATKTGYTFGGWFDDKECTGTAIESLGATAYTADITLYAKWTLNATYSLNVVAGDGISQVAGSTDPVTLGHTYDIKATPKTGYLFSTWTADPAENATFGSATTANTTVTVNNGSVTVTASATEIMSTLTTSNQYNAGDPGYAAPSATVSEIGIATTATVTAAAAGNGYTFTGWTFTNCTRTDGGAADATSITVRSNGDGKAATVVANYAEDLTTSWVLKGSFVDDFATAYKFVKKSGESTGKVAYVSLDLADSKAYQFKVVDGDTWYGNNNSNEQYWIKATAENWEFYSDAGNCHMKSSVAGTYTFKIDFSGTYPKVSVQFPTAYKITYGVGTIGGTDKVTTTPSITSGSLVLASTEITFSKGDTEAGYTWKNWNSKADGTGTVLGTGDTYVSSNRAGDITVYACYDLDTYNITYNLNGGTGATNTTYNVTTATITLPTPSKTGYTFAGWYENANLTGNKVTQIAKGSTGHKEFWAKWTADEYTIKWDANGGTVEPTTSTYTYDGDPVALPTPKREGYTFNGWFTASSGGERINDVGKENKPTSNVTYYAHWTENLFLVTISTSANGSVTPSGEKQIGIVGLSVSATANTGYQFENWTVTGGAKVANANSASTTVTATAAGTVIANFSAINYTITYNNLDGGTNHADNPTNYTIETPTITLQAPTRTGYSFAGWYTTNNFSGDPVTEITQGSTGNKTFYAKWIEQKEIYLVGEFGWDNPTEEYKFTAHPTKPGVYTLTRPFEKRDHYDMTDPNGPGQPEYEFKLQVDGKKYTVKTENGKKILQYTRQSKTKVLSDGTNYNSAPYYNLLLQADISGDYVFEYNVESQELTVEHPAYQPEASFIVGDFSDGQTGTDALPKDGGAGHDWTEEHGIKFNNDNTAEICFNGTGKKWEFKIKINGIWYGAEGLVIEADGTYTLSNTYAFQSETNCAIQTSGVNGCYTFTYEDNGDGTIDLTVGFPKQSENPTTVYLKPNDEWKADNARFAVYYWNNGGNSWKNMTPVDCNGDYYSVDIPKGYSNFIFCRMNGANQTNNWNNKWNQTLDLTLPTNGNTLYDIESAKYIYLTPNSNWKQSNDQGQAPRFAAYFMNSDKSSHTWVSMDAVQGETDVYVAKIPENQKYVILCRMNGGNQTNDWNNKWNQTGDLDIPTDKNHYTVKSGTWDNGGGTWSVHGDYCGWTTYTEPTYDVTINITGKGAIVINGQTYEGTSEGKTKLTIEDIVVNQALTVTAITPADRWDYEGDATITIGSRVQGEPLKVDGIYEICASATINIEFIQKYCQVTFRHDFPKGGSYPEQINPQIVKKGDKAVQPTLVDVEGHLFAGWYPNGSEYTDENKFNFDTPIEQDITLYARWVRYEQCIFFKNNLNWDNIYVYTFKGDVWGNDGKGVYPANRYEYGKMTQIGYTDVYYYILTQPDGFNHIAFSDYDMHDYAPFWGYSAIYRGDRSDKMQLFIPQKDQKPTRAKDSTTEYYSEGIWMKYNSTESGYKWSSDKNGWSTDINPFTAPNKGGYSFTTKVSLEGGKEYLFKINNIKNDWYSEVHTFTQEECTDRWFKVESDPNKNAIIQPNATGEYLFTIYLGEGKVMVSLEYPLGIGDYRLAYKDNTADSFHPGHYIRKRSTGTHRDTTSFFVLHDKAPVILLQECIDIKPETGEVTWQTLKEYTSCPVNKTTVYNFVLLQEEGNDVNLATSETHLYTGDFYIRTDDAPGGWDYFRQNSNKMTFSSYAQQHEDFDHYFCKWIHKDKNVRYTVANDYSYCISDTLFADDIIGGNDGTIEVLPVQANVRFMWDSRDNSIGRAYIAGSSNQADRFLVVEGKDNNLKDAAGNDLMEGQHDTNRYGLEAYEEILKDMGNWIYQVDVKANKDALIKLTALYNGTIQYFKGTEGEEDNAYIRLLASDATDTYKIRLIYDFKVNQLIIAWLVDNEDIEENMVLGADMMIIRHNQEQAKQINFNNATDTIKNVGKAYAVMTFDKYFLNNRTYPNADGEGGGNTLPNNEQLSAHARALYWISFPFNVKLSDVSGFGEYGDYWILEYYDGADRAQNGLWVDTDTYWKYITNPDYTIQAGQGYVLSLNLNKMGYESTVFTNTAEVSLFFPSTDSLHIITHNLPTAVEVPAHECTIERENGIHKIYDSHWNMIGVPGFADIENVPVGDNLFNDERKLIDEEEVTFYYQYVPEDNTYDAKSKNSENFQIMYSYMVQYYGTINWMTPAFNGPSAIAARSASSMPSEYNMLLELASSNNTADQTYIKLQEERATVDFDLNLDLTKIMNHGENIYTLTGSQDIKCAGNTLPIQRITIPVGVRVDTAGEYTFRMPDGTDGISVTLVDNVTGTHTDMLMDEYTITLDAGTIENRFYLVVDPDRTATSVENVGEEAKGEEAKGQIKKFLIDGKLFIRTADGIFDAKGQRL